MHTRHIAEITDPVTSELVHLEADTETGLEQLLDDHFAAAYPPPATAPSDDQGAPVS